MTIGQKRKLIFFGSIAVVVLAASIVLVRDYLLMKSTRVPVIETPVVQAPIVSNTTAQACDADARQCSDGTVVGRVGPNCEFEVCPNAVVRQRVELQGAYVCLLHKNTSGVQTDECQAGIKTAEDIYYALDFNLMSQMGTELKVGDRFSARGMLSPIEMLSSNFLRDTYIVEGIFSVTDSVTKL